MQSMTAEDVLTIHRLELPRADDQCRGECAGSTTDKPRACILARNVFHTLHICSDPTCYCHSQQRYELERLIG